MSKMNEKLKILLKNNKWTQAQLAERMDFTPDAVSSWVRGKNHLSVETVKKLCEIFCIRIQDFVNDDYDIPEVDADLPFPTCSYPKILCDSVHSIVDITLARKGKLHRICRYCFEICLRRSF